MRESSKYNDTFVCRPRQNAGKWENVRTHHNPDYPSVYSAELAEEFWRGTVLGMWSDRKLMGRTDGGILRCNASCCRVYVNFGKRRRRITTYWTIGDRIRKWRTIVVTR